MAQEWWSNDKTVQPAKAVSTGVEIGPKPEKPDKPTETFRMATAAEKAAAGLDPARSYQINNVTGEFKDVGGQPTAKPAMEADPNRLPQINTGLSAVQDLRKISDKFLSVGKQAGNVAETPILGSLLGQNRADLEGSIEILKGIIIQDQLARLAKINPAGVTGLANSPSEQERFVSAIANLNPDQSPEQFQIGLKRAEDYLKRQAQDVGGQPEVAPGAAPAQTASPIKAGERIQTEQDLAAQSALQDAWNSGKSVDEIIAINQQLGRGAFTPDAIKLMRDSRAQGQPLSFYATPTGEPTATQEAIGGFLGTDVGQAVGGYTTGAANALTLGQMDDAAKAYFRENAPVSSFTGEVTGGILGALPFVKGAQAITAGTRIAPEVAALIGEGVYGAVYGAGEAPEGQGLTGALIGGGSALLGGTLANRFLPGGPGTFSGVARETPPAGVVMPEVPVSTASQEAALSQRLYDIQNQLRTGRGSPELEQESLAISRQLRDLQTPEYMRPGYVPPRRDMPMSEPMPASTTSEEALLSQRYRDIQDQLQTGTGSPALEQESLAITQRLRWLQTPEYMKAGAVEPPPIQGLSPAPGAPPAGAQIGSEEMISLAQKAVSRGPGASKARAQLAEIAKTNPEAKAAADRLGLELPVDVLSDNSQLKEVVGLTRSQIGSEAKQAWNETVQAASDRAHAAMDELDAVTDISQVSADVFDRLDNAQKSLGRQASDLRQEVTDAVDVRGRVDATGIKSWLQTRIDDLGGGKEGIAALSPEEKRLWGIVSKGQPTYALLNEQRDLIGQALEKGTGPWSNTNMKRLKDIYGSLANDQINFIEASAGKEIADKQRAANTLFKQMYDGREQMEKIFTKNLSGGLAPLMQRAITQGTKGNAQTLNTLVKIIPEDMRGKVLTSALFKAAKATDDTFSFTNFANIYRDLRSNSAVYKELAKAVGPEGDKLLTDLYAVSRRLSEADKNISRTGASTQLQLLNSERFLSRILMASGGAAGAGLIGSALGGPGAAIVGAGLAAAAPEIAQRVGKTNAQKLHNLMSSEAFRDLTMSAATGDALDRNINRVAGSKQFRDYAKAIGLEMKEGRNWLRSAITAGGVGEMGPEESAPPGSIVVRPQ